MLINLVFAADNNYAQHLTVALFSLLSNSNLKNTYQVNILDGGISQNNKEKIESSLKEFPNKEIAYIKIDKNIFKDTSNYLHLNQTAYYRLLLPRLFSKFNSILYLDCDLIFFEDVANLYKEISNKHYAAAVKIFHPNYSQVLRKTFFLSQDSLIFNSGVILFNLKKMREENIVKKLIAWMNDHKKELYAADQDVLNIVFNGKVKELDPKWNVSSYIFYAKDHNYCQLNKNKFLELKNIPAIIHFDGAKPWSYGNFHPYKNQYFAILDQTKFSGWRPKFNFKTFIANSSFYFSTKIANLFPSFIYNQLEKFYLKNNFLERRYKNISIQRLGTKFRQMKLPTIIRAIRYLYRLLISLKNLYYEYFKQYDIFVKNNLETITAINYGKSIARYGDGEFELINGKSIPFQDFDHDLQTRLKQLLINKRDDLLIAIPNTFASLKELTFFESIFWRIFMSEKRNELKKFLIRNQVYYSSFITRPYLRFKDKKHAKEIFQQWQKLWNNKKILIIEGEETRFGVNNDFLDNCKSVKRIIAPTVNAFSKYSILLEEATKQIKKFDLILIALGPTATVLAADLSRKNIQAIDIGHLDIEYEWFQMKAKKREPIKNKVIIELGNQIVEPIFNEKYQSEIISTII